MNMMKASKTSWVKVADLQDLPADRPYAIFLEDQLLIAVQQQHEVIVYQGLCPHQAARLDRGKIVDGWIYCPQHQARFAITDGICSGGWRLPALTRYRSKVDAAQLWLALPLTAEADGLSPA
jgi:3-phenylpropionate/trans-cinnamate dioxygenase ferredoxin subunit